MNTYPRIKLRYFFILLFIFLFPALSFAEGTIATVPLDLKNHFVGQFAIAVTVIAYIIAMTEDLHQMSKAKPMVLASGIIWFAIFIYYSAEYGTAKNVAVIFQSNLTAYSCFKSR
jgi:hypothetical protein